MDAPTFVTGDQVRAAVAALGIDMIEFETIRSIDIDPRHVVVTASRRNEGGHFYMDGNDIATDRHVLGVCWS